MSFFSPKSIKPIIESLKHLIDSKAEMPNWNENDPSSSSYIANRPFYEDKKANVVKKIDTKFLPDMDKVKTGKFTISNGNNNSVIVTSDNGATYISSADGSVTCIGEDDLGMYIYDFTDIPVYKFFAPTSSRVHNSAHQNNYDLNVADYPNATSISDYAFQSTSIQTASFPLATTIGNYAFRYCYSLTNVNLPKVTALYSRCFYSCSSLVNIDLPSVTSISAYAFYGCSKLTTLILRSKTRCTLSSTNTFTSTPIKSGTGYIYVPKDLIDSYKSASNWSTYAAQFRAIEDYPEICGGGAGSGLPSVTTDDNGKTVSVVDGAWELVDMTDAITVDAALDANSENPVQNKVIVAEIDGVKATISDIITVEEIDAICGTANETWTFTLDDGSTVTKQVITSV